ncbi:hypothetical protein [Pajaroellobacter abortibovis]|uniref:RNA polymerase sigma-70 region 3 domain-containing protein n=1 Tax=Pajaroellobacter abortibovis TaxID=1882918 RepID=A0A1L6MXT6_9BACT|nr:hypothetical protein [Pajaroellobacter abortibovis]APS00403.1 hypothetical protein BCY86_06710 [Pajaroellobacter abortibovis]
MDSPQHQPSSAAKGHLIRIPTYVSEQIHQANSSIHTLSRATGKEPTNQEPAKAIGLSEEKVEQARKGWLDTPISRSPYRRRRRADIPRLATGYAQPFT